MGTMHPLAAHASKADHDAHHGHGRHAAPAPAATAHAWTLSARTAAPLAANRPANLLLELRDAHGRPIPAADLARVHEETLHLLVVDETLSDYHHLHPVEETPGNYAVPFTPRVGGRYLVFADVTDRASQTQRYLRAAVRADGARPRARHEVSHVAVVDGYRFELSVPHGISVASGGHLTVRVTDENGQAVRHLAPVMGAFAHGVGFSKDLDTVLHVHPHGKEPKSGADRAGPDLGFHVSPVRTGFHRLYVQVRIDGRVRFASFGLHVDP